MTSAALHYPRLFLSLVKFEHTIFALPFAYIGAFLAVDGVPSASDLLWITVAMIGARSLAMASTRETRAPRAASSHEVP
jgi:4-hydroxybenzoate polyprenyltransferase